MKGELVVFRGGVGNPWTRASKDKIKRVIVILGGQNVFGWTKCFWVD